MAIDPKMLDRRTVARYIAREELSERDYEKHLKSLPDLEEKVEAVSVEQPETRTAPTVH